jgi:glycerol kinase
MQAGLCPEPEMFARNWALETRFEPISDRSVPDALYGNWRDAVKRTLSRQS